MLLAIVDLVLVAYGIRRGDPLGIAIGALFILVGAAIALRAAGAALVTDQDSVIVRNITRTVRLPWPEIASFYVGRYKMLGCVLIVRLTSGKSVPVFAVQGITGQPHRKTSVAARGMADELNKELEAINGVAPASHDEVDYPSRCAHPKPS